MFAEVQTLTPLVPTRELSFLRHCKKLTADKWAVVDVSVDNVEPDARTSSMVSKCLKKPSGCVIEEQTNGRCKVTRSHEHDMNRIIGRSSSNRTAPWKCQLLRIHLLVCEPSR